MSSDEIKLKKIGYNKWANDEYQVDVDSGFVCGYHTIMPSHAPSLTIACVIFRLGNKKKLFNITDDSYKRPPIDFTCDGPLNDYDCYICPKSEKKTILSQSMSRQHFFNIKKNKNMASGEIKLAQVDYKKWANGEYQVNVWNLGSCDEVIQKNETLWKIDHVIFRLGDDEKLVKIPDKLCIDEDIHFTFGGERGELHKYRCYVCPKAEKKTNNQKLNEIPLKTEQTKLVLKDRNYLNVVYDNDGKLTFKRGTQSFEKIEITRFTVVQKIPDATCETKFERKQPWEYGSKVEIPPYPVQSITIEKFKAFKIVYEELDLSKQ